MAIFGSSDALLAYLRGHRVVPVSSALDLGAVPPEQVVSGYITLWNTASVPVTVIGGSSDCACTLIEDLPLTIPPGQTGRVSVRFKSPGGRGEFIHHAKIWTDAGGRRTILVAVVGRSTGP